VPNVGGLSGRAVCRVAACRRASQAAARRRCARAAAHGRRAPPPPADPPHPTRRREFWKKNYATIKKDNLKLPILLRECSGVQARLVAVYGAPAPAKFARVRPPRLAQPRAARPQRRTRRRASRSTG
jgi:hypothetical protein